MALAGIERGRGTREKRLERLLTSSEGKKNDEGVTILRVLKGLICLLGPNWTILKYFGCEWYLPIPQERLMELILNKILIG